MNVVIWHNPRCSKSRQGLQLIRDRGFEPEIVKYLETPPTAEELRRALDLLGLEPRQLMRRKEKEYSELGLADEELSNEALITAMVEHPCLIERPVVFASGKAALGRPPESIADIL